MTVSPLELLEEAYKEEVMKRLMDNLVPIIMATVSYGFLIGEDFDRALFFMLASILAVVADIKRDLKEGK